MALGEIDLSFTDNIEDNSKLIDTLVKCFNKYYPNLKHTDTKMYTENDKKIIGLTFNGFGSFKCIACDMHHIPTDQGIKMYYEMDKKIGYYKCPSKQANYRHKEYRTYIIYSCDEIKGPITRTKETELLYNWLDNNKFITINRKVKGKGILSNPLYEE